MADPYSPPPPGVPAPPGSPTPPGTAARVFRGLRRIGGVFSLAYNGYSAEQALEQVIETGEVTAQNVADLAGALPLPVIVLGPNQTSQITGQFGPTNQQPREQRRITRTNAGGLTRVLLIPDQRPKVN